MVELPYRDRSEAGRRLAAALKAYSGRADLLVLALPRGGVPVGYEVARALNAPLDLMLVRKLGAPGREELAMGAIATGGARVLNDEVVRGLHVSDEAIEAKVKREREELERRQRLYRGDRPEPEMAGRCVILVDDGLATGATMQAAAHAARQQEPGRIIVAVPVAPAEALYRLREIADRVICPATPPDFMAVGQWYTQFPQTTDEEIRELLARAWRDRGADRRTDRATG